MNELTAAGPCAKGERGGVADGGAEDFKIQPHLYDVKGIVRSRVTRGTLPGATVQVSKLSAHGAPERVQDLVADEDGIFALGALRPGQYELLCDGEDVDEDGVPRTYVEKSVQIDVAGDIVPGTRENPGLADITLGLDTFTVSGAVLGSHDPNDHPLANAHVRIRGKGQMSIHTRFHHTGHGMLSGVDLSE